MNEIIAAIAGAVIGGVVIFLVAQKDRKKRDYEHLDSLYQKVLELYLRHPQFQDVQEIADVEQASKHEALLYDAFAAIIHNFLESIFDLATTGDEIDPQWARIFDYHAKLHLRWLLCNDKPFEPNYCEFVRIRYQI